MELLKIRILCMVQLPQSRVYVNGTFGWVNFSNRLQKSRWGTPGIRYLNEAFMDAYFRPELRDCSFSLKTCSLIKLTRYREHERGSDIFRPSMKVSCTLLHCIQLKTTDFSIQCDKGYQIYLCMVDFSRCNRLQHENSFFF